MMPNMMTAGPRLMKSLQALKENPAKFFMQRGFNLPGTVGTDPQKILNYLVQSGQISQDQVNNAYQMAQRLRK